MGGVRSRSACVASVLLAAICLMLAAIASNAHAQSGLFLFVPVDPGSGVFTTNADGTLGAGTTIAGGNLGGQAAVRGDQAFAYVTFNISNSLQVINTATQSVVQTVTSGLNQPLGATLSPNGSTLYVANNGGFQTTVLVYSVNATTGTLTQTATINMGAGSQPRTMAVSPDGSRLYVVNEGANTLGVVNTATNTITATIPVGNSPQFVALNPAGTVAYVGDGAATASP